MRSVMYFLLISSLLIPAISRSQAADPENFEMWEDHQVASAGLRKKLPSSLLASRNLIGPAENTSASVARSLSSGNLESMPDESPEDFVIHFGAGAAWLFPLRLADNARTDMLLSMFSASWAPFGLVGEVGLDMAIGKKSDFFLLPNLKFYFAKHRIFSIYLEGSAAIYSHPSGTDLGGGAGIGIIFGLMDHLAIEIRASAMVLGYSGEQFFAQADTSGQIPADLSSLIICPAVGTRLVARF